MTPINTLSLRVQGDGRLLSFPVSRVINAGYVGRDQQAVRAHIEELSQAGIPAPPSVPMLFPIPADRLNTHERVEVYGTETSGEAEFVLLLSGQEIFVAVGSDHTDRALERHDLVKSKQICNNVISREVWPYSAVRGHWDRLRLQGWIRPPHTDREILYQDADLADILSADQLLELVHDRLGNGRPRDGLVLFSGTIPLLHGEFVYSDNFRAELVDQAAGRRLTCQYRVLQLDAPLSEVPRSTKITP